MKCLRFLGFILGVLAVLAAGVTNSGLGVAAVSAAAIPLKVGIFPYDTTGGWTIGIAKEKGFFAQEGLDVALQGTFQMVAGLIGGTFDIIGTSNDPPILAAARGEPLVVIGVLSSRPSQIFIGAPDIQSAQHLKGKVIGVWKIPSGDMFLVQRFLKKEGVDEKSVRFLPAGGSRDRLAALVTGRISGATFDIPHSILAKKQGMRWLNTQSYWEPMAWNASVATPKWAAANADAVVKYLRAVHRAVDWMNDAANIDEATSILTRLSGFEASVVREVLNASREGGEYVAVRPTPALFELPHEMLLKQEILAKPVDLTRVVDASYYDRAFKGRRD